MTPPRVAVLTGAGVSTGSGIPDFRGPAGVWTLTPDRAALLEIDAYRGSSALRCDAWADWAAHPAWTARPSAAHDALARLVTAGAARCVITQNFDGLHQAAGLAASQVVELHGTLRTTSCLTCGLSLATEQVLARLAVHPDPACTWCGGILKADIVYFGEQLPEAAMEAAIREAQECDVFVAVGTTLSVFPAAGLAGLAAREGAELVIVNAEPTQYDAVASRLIREPIEQAVPALVEELLGA